MNGKIKKAFVFILVTVIAVSVFGCTSRPAEKEALQNTKKPGGETALTSGPARTPENTEAPSPGSASPENTETPSPGSASPDNSDPPGSDYYVPDVEGRIRLNYYNSASSAEASSINDWVAAFKEKYPDCDVEIELSSLDKSKVQAQIASGTVGDVFFLRAKDVYDYAVAQKILMPLEYYAEVFGLDLSNIVSSVYEIGNAEGHLYMVARDYDRVALMYNKTAVNAAGLTDPVSLDIGGEWTWEMFRAYCSILTKDTDGDGMIDQLGGNMRFGYAPVYIPFLEGYGGTWYDTVNKKVSFISSDKDGISPVFAGVREMVDTVRSGTVRYEPVIGVENGDMPSAIKDTPELNSYYDFDPAADIVFRDAQFSSFSAFGNAYDSANVEWNCVSFPALPVHKVGTDASGFAVFNKTTNPDAAAALCLSLYTEDGQRAYVSESGSVPSIRTLIDDTFWKVPFQDSVHNTKEGIYYDAWISYPESDTCAGAACVLPPEIAFIVENAMQNVVPNAINGIWSVADTLSRLETEANEAWKTLAG